MDICIGWPGKVHDARVLVNSSLYAKASSWKSFPSWKRRFCGVDVPLVMLGDPAYPLVSWLMKPYTLNDHTPADEKHFNYRQSRARMVKENAFGRLKGRWRCPEADGLQAGKCPSSGCYLRGASQYQEVR